MQSTQGPWEYVTEKGDGLKAPLYAIKSATSYICTLFANGEERDANARLIASAPDLLKTLKEIIEYYPDSLEYEDKQRFALLIAKAEVADAEG